MNKTFKIVESYLGNKNIKAYENGKKILDIILNEYNIDGAIKILSALGYRLTYRSY